MYDHTRSSATRQEYPQKWTVSSARLEPRAVPIRDAIDDVVT